MSVFLIDGQALRKSVPYLTVSISAIANARHASTTALALCIIAGSCLPLILSSVLVISERLTLFCSLYIDGVEVINSDGMHSGISLSGSICLAKGFHDLKIYYFENYSGERLRLNIESIEIPNQPIPADMLYVK